MGDAGLLLLTKTFQFEANPEAFEAGMPQAFNGRQLERMTDPLEINEVRTLIERHAQFTGSTVAEKLLARFEDHVGEFVKVMPTDYKRVLEERKQAASAG